MCRGQNPTNQAETLTVRDAITKVKAGELNAVVLDRITQARATEAIPVLEEQFARVSRTFDRARIAQVLIRLGDKNDTYWDYLVQLATPAVTSDAPNPWTYGPDGKAVPGSSPEFLAWAKAHHVSLDSKADDGLSAREEHVYGLPGKVLLLGATGDRRAIPLLRRALSSPNYLIESAAAKGLAEIQDEESIPSIIAACEKAPADAASAIAQPLVYFDDPRAQRAVDTYLSAELAKSLRERKAQGHTPFH